MSRDDPRTDEVQIKVGQIWKQRLIDKSRRLPRRRDYLRVIEVKGDEITVRYFTEACITFTRHEFYDYHFYPGKLRYAYLLEAPRKS